MLVSLAMGRDHQEDPVMVRFTDVPARPGWTGRAPWIIFLLTFLAFPQLAGNAQDPAEPPGGTAEAVAEAATEAATETVAETAAETATNGGIEATTDATTEHTFQLVYFGEDAGQESFQIHEDPEIGALLVTAQAKVTLAGRNFDLTQQLRVDRTSFTLQTYELAALVGRESQSIRAARQGDSVIVAAEAPGGSFRRAYYEPGEVLVLDNLLANHLALLGKRIAADGFRAETLRVAVPQAGMVLPAAIVPQAAGPTGERTVEVKIGGVTEVLSFDADGEVERIEVPSQKILYEKVIPGETGEARPRKRRRDDDSIQESPASPARRLYQEEMIRFVSNATDLDGILTLPTGGQKIPYPAVLFVHGSGPHDRDETIGPNRPFRDLAHGLAVFGIASLRYDKRTLVAPTTFDPVRGTVKEEVIDDAVAALEALRSQSRIDRKVLVVLGHSLGGGLAATIAERGGPVAGLVLLAASPRPLDELMADQLTYLRDQARDQGILSDEQERMYASLFAQLDSLQAGNLPDRSMILGMSGHYLRDYRKRDLAADLLAFRGPVLFLQGGKDYQVTQRDLDLWKEVAKQGGKQNATFRSFPELGHLFMPIEGEPSPSALFVPGKVDPAVTDEIARFVNSLD
jgi:pimeloyl-ACP methyl ester carboxylesterase